MANDPIKELASPDLEREFEQVVIPAIYRRLQTEDYGEAVEILNNFYRSKFDQDESRWLKHKCDSWKALLFEKQGRYQEALSLYESLAQELGVKPTLFNYLQVDVARVLYKLGDTTAIVEIEKALESPRDSSMSDQLTALNLYVDILGEGRSIAPQYQSLVKHLVNGLGIEWRENDWAEPRNLSHLVKELTQKNQEANRRYSRMLIELDEIEDDSQALCLLKKYVSEESVGYYRNLAIKELDELANPSSFC